LTKQEKQGTLVVREDIPLEAQVEMATGELFPRDQ
jgi:hypothetical protein